MRFLALHLHTTHAKSFLVPASLTSLLKTSRSLLPLSLSRPEHICLTPISTEAQSRLPHTTAASTSDRDSSRESFLFSNLPRTCPGCGAFSQTLEPEEAGFYSATRKSVQVFIASQHVPERRRVQEEACTYATAVAQADQSLLQSLGLDQDSQSVEESPPKEAIDAPICDRCHDLLHHNRGFSILHPTLQSIQDIFSESPYKYNHIYHVLDAADFPLSLVPQIQQYLSIAPQRSQNRRSKLGKYHHDRKAEMSFIITRSDLLAPKKEQVDSMMPYLLQVLRDALGSSGKDIRLGNVRCVSSKRGWWTKALKEEIWKRGGGGWMVGKVNVGKSNLFENVFPKGRNEDISFGALRHAATKAVDLDEGILTQARLNGTETREQVNPDLPLAGLGNQPKTSLLPPAPIEKSYPVMPIVSSLPGTTASPIRLRFGGGKGELIDLPGLSRGNLDHYVRDEHKLDLVMRQRIKAEQVSVKPGQSLLIGGLIRIECLTPEVVLLACPFVPLPYHVTSTEKATAVHTQQVSSGIPTITSLDTGEKISSAGIFHLEWDVTKNRTGPLTASAGVGLKPSALHFVVFSADILIEGCGWIELSVEIRKRALEASQANSGTGDVNNKSMFPAVQVFSPEGRSVGIRRPMGAWMMGGSRPLPVSRRKTRPRRSMKGVKKREKMAARQNKAAAS